MSNQNEGWKNTLKRGVASALGVLIGSYLIDGISYESNWTLFFAVVLLGFLSAFLRPLLVLLALPFVLLTFGLGILFINALLYMIVGKLLAGFTVLTYGDAFLGALCVTLVNLLLKGWIESGSRTKMRGGRKIAGASRRGSSRPRRAKDEVIDI